MLNSLLFNVTDIPAELLTHIFSFVKKPADLMSLAAVNQAFRGLAIESRLWVKIATDLHVTVVDLYHPREEVLTFIRQCNQATQIFLLAFDKECRAKDLFTQYELVLTQLRLTAQTKLNKLVNENFPFEQLLHIKEYQNFTNYYLHCLLEAGAKIPSRRVQLSICKVPDDVLSLNDVAYIHPLYLRGLKDPYCVITCSGHFNKILPLMACDRIEIGYLALNRLQRTSCCSALDDKKTIVFSKLTDYQGYKELRKIEISIKVSQNKQINPTDEQIKQVFLQKFESHLLNAPHAVLIEADGKTWELKIENLELAYRNTSFNASIAILQTQLNPKITIKWLNY